MILRRTTNEVELSYMLKKNNTMCSEIIVTPLSLDEIKSNGHICY